MNKRSQATGEGAPTEARRPTPATPSSEEMDKVRDIVSSFERAMLVTRTPAGELRSRPMQIVAQQHGGTLVFVTHKDDAKVSELEAEPRVNVALQDGARFVSVSGEATVDTDRERIGLHFQKAWTVWFPDGLDDPNIALIDVHPTTVEYWDGSGLNKLRYMVAAARAVMNEEAIDPGAMEHDTVEVRRGR